VLDLRLAALGQIVYTRSDRYVRKARLQAIGMERTDFVIGPCPPPVGDRLRAAFARSTPIFDRELPIPGERDRPSELALT
jgi:hypothetical protein